MSTTTEELGAEKWAEYFDSLTPGIEGKLVTVEVMSEELGDQLDVERLPLQAIGYDPKDNVLEVAVGGRGVSHRADLCSGARERSPSGRSTAPGERQALVTLIDGQLEHSSQAALCAP